MTYGGGLAPEFREDPDAEKHFAALKGLLDDVNAEDKGCTEKVFRGLMGAMTAPGHLSHLERPNFEFAQYIYPQGQHRGNQHHVHPAQFVPHFRRVEANL